MDATAGVEPATLPDMSRGPGPPGSPRCAQSLTPWTPTKASSVNLGFAVCLRVSLAGVSGRGGGQPPSAARHPGPKHPFQRLAQFRRATVRRNPSCIRPRQAPRTCRTSSRGSPRRRPATASDPPSATRPAPLPEPFAHRSMGSSMTTSVSTAAHPRARDEDELLDLLGGQRPRLEQHAGVLEPVSRSTRNVRQSSFSRSQQSRYQCRSAGEKGDRLDPSARHLAGGRGIGESNPLVVAAGQREFAEHLARDASPGGCRPAGPHRRARDPSPQRNGEHLLQLRERRQRRLRPADEVLGCRDPQADRDRDGLFVGEKQRWHRAAGLESSRPRRRARTRCGSRVREGARRRAGRCAR